MHDIDYEEARATVPSSASPRFAMELVFYGINGVAWSVGLLRDPFTRSVGAGPAASRKTLRVRQQVAEK